MDTLGRTYESDVEGTVIAWSEMGAGRALVLLHGLADSRRTWRRVAPSLAREFRVLMPDLPGHGWSGRPDAPYTLDWHARTIAHWMDAAGVERAHVCGHSFGGGIAQWMLLDYRSRIDRLALVAPGGLGRQVGLPLKLAAFPWLGPALSYPVIRFGLFLGQQFFPKSFGVMELEEARILFRMYGIDGTARAFRRSLAGVVKLSGQYMQTIERVCEVKSPPAVALFWGGEDPVIPVSHAAGLLDSFMGITLTTYPGCGHFPQLDAHIALGRDLIDFFCDPHRSPAVLRSRKSEHTPTSDADRHRLRPA